jgi:uncharacterized protein
MKIAVRDISAQPIQVEGEMMITELADPAQSIYCKDPVKIIAMAQSTPGTITVHAQAVAFLCCECSRCLTSFNKNIQKEMVFHYPMDSVTAEIDIGDDVRQEIIVDIPAKILCQDDCRGLCSGCGADLNNEKCQCDEII